MSEIAQPCTDTAPLDPVQLLLPSLSAMVQDLAHMLPPSSMVHALQAKQLLLQMGNAAQVVGLRSVQQLMHAMLAPLELYTQTGQAGVDKSGELLQLAARDLQDFLEATGRGEQPSPQSLFASYRALSKLNGKDTAHPCDLWDHAWTLATLPAPEDVDPLSPCAELRTQLDQQVLGLLRTSDPALCSTLKKLCLGLAAHLPDTTTWQLAAAWLEGIEHLLLDVDLYAKRMASRLLAHYASIVKSQDCAAPANLQQELLYFCHQACSAAQSREIALPQLLHKVHAVCHKAAALEQDRASATIPVAQPLTQQRPALAPALPEFEAAPEIQPAATLVKGLADANQIEPDHDFLQAAQQLSDELDTDISQWLTDESATLPESTADHAGELSRLAWATGCAEIANLSHMLQRCLLRMTAETSVAQRRTCHIANEEIRRLLHQFAAGFMRRAHPQVMDALHGLYAQLPEPLLNFRLQLPEPLDSQATHAESSDMNACDRPVLQPDVEEDERAAQELAATSATLDAMHFSVFEEEMLGLWPQLQAAYKQWVQSPQDSHARQSLLRHLHTLKGGARLAGAMAWASQVHALEGLALDAMLNNGPRGPASLLQPLEALRVAFVALQQEMASRHPERHADRLKQNPLEAVARHTQALWSTQDSGQKALQASQLSLQEIASGLNRLRMHIKDCAAWADSLMLHGDSDLPYEWHEELHDLVHALDDCTDDLGTAQQQLQHSMADATQALGTHSGHLRALQQTLLYARQRPLAHIQERLAHCVQLAAKDCGKTVEMIWQGIDTLMESSVLEALTPAIEHLLRNSVAHGIENAPARQAAKKAASGKILVRLHNTDQLQVLSIMDDGAGLNLQAIRDKAVRLGVIDANEPVDSARAALLILHPGLSTASDVTEVAGRGIGMDAVVQIVTDLRGKLKVTNNPGKGCRIDISLPAPPHVEQVIALRAGSWRVAVLARNLEAVRRVPMNIADQALLKGILHDPASGPLPIYWAGAVWQQSRRSLEPPLDGQRQLLIVRSDTSRWGMIVDEVLGTQEVTLQVAADLEVQIPGLLGTAAQPSGQVLQVYEAAAVLSAHEKRLLTQHDDEPAENPEQEPERPLVLLADDSLSVRRLAQHLLQSQGYRVITAADGLEALQLLEQAQEIPALLIADIEMPNMDGMELLRRVRAQQRLEQLPVVMLTAHSAGPVSQKAIDMGAQAFLTKPYSPGDLLAQVRRYGVAAAVVSA